MNAETVSDAITDIRAITGSHVTSIGRVLVVKKVCSFEETRAIYAAVGPQRVWNADNMTKIQL